MALLILRQDGIDKGAGTAFSLCARDVNNVEAIKIRRLPKGESVGGLECVLIWDVR